MNPTTLEHLALESLIPYARNSRTHSAEQVAQVAASIKEFGFTNPVLIDGDGGIIAGHGRVLAARKLGLETVPAIRIDYMTDAQKRAYVIADNKLALNAGWDDDLLALELGDLQAEGFDLALTGFDDDELAALLLDEEEAPSEGLTDADDVPEPMPDPVSVPGDVWQLGPHRVMCGDSTSITDVEKMMGGAIAQLLHADPPYGMGKEGDGVANDNLYGADLDRFQMDWWAAFSTVLTHNATAYIWGNAPDLWRLWYAGGLSNAGKLLMRNEIVWDKENGSGQRDPGMNMYPPISERCLMIHIGDQWYGNVNADSYFEGWEPVRAYLEGEAKAAGLDASKARDLCGVGMFSHWFTKSQWTLIPENHYQTLARAFPGRFTKPWAELKREQEAAQQEFRKMVEEKRSYFDNTHETMGDVWRYPRVTGDERHGHATPKPVEMMERVMKSSLPPGGLCVEPFGGSGSTLMGAERTGRACYSMELQGRYVDVIVRRWQAFTGKAAVHAVTGQEFGE